MKLKPLSNRQTKIAGNEQNLVFFVYFLLSDLINCHTSESQDRVRKPTCISLLAPLTLMLFRNLRELETK
jgi:hypothetical protein